MSHASRTFSFCSDFCSWALAITFPAYVMLVAMSVSSKHFANPPCDMKGMRSQLEDMTGL